MGMEPLPFLRSRPLLTNVLVALVYAAVGYATLALGESQGLELRRVIWAASGIAVAAALLLPFPIWIGAAVGGAIATALRDEKWLHVVGTGVANGLEVVIATSALRFVGFDPAMRRVRDILYLIALACGLAAASAAFISVMSLDLVGGVPTGRFQQIYALWWLTHAMGILTLVPVALTLTLNGAGIQRRSAIEVIGVLGSVAVLTSLPFAVHEDGVLARLFFVPIPLLLWASLRLGMAGAAMGGLITTSIAMNAAVHDWGPLAVGIPNETLALTLVFCVVVMTSSLISAALVEGTERARAEHQSGERRLRAVLDAASEGLVVVDATGSITHVNRAVTTIWPDGLPVPTLRAPVADFLAPLAAHIASPEARAVLSTTRGADMARGTLQLPDDQTWEVDVDPLSDLAVDGGRVWSFRDITDRVRAETERRQLEAQLLHTQKLESLGVLAGGIAHDFNNLLMGIRGRAELIEMNEPLPREIRGDITGILRTTDEAAALCRQMLAYAGRGAIEVRTVDLSACAREIQDMLRVSVSRRVQLVLELSAEPLPIAGDITQLRQIILNLVTNASDAVEATGRSGTVRVRTYPARLDRAWQARQVIAAERTDEAFAVLEVSDDGVGMDEATARQVFDPFFSSKGAGRGLGLAASLGVIRSHKGSLALTSAPGIGSRFEIALPMAANAPLAAAVADAGRPLSRFAGRTVLVVDDEEGVRAVVTRMLVAAGLHVRQACDGDEALDAFVTPGGAPIDVVLLDLTMPKRSGPATLTEMRARGINVPEIIASGFSAEAVPDGAGIAGFVQKPFKRETLERAVADALAGGSRPIDRRHA